MKRSLARTASYLPAIAVLLACVVGVTLPNATPSLSTIATILWLLGAGGASCLLLRRAIDADDRTRDLARRLGQEQDARRALDAILGDTQAVLSKVVRQLEEFTRLNGIAHQLEIAPGPLGEPEPPAFEGDALLYRVLQEALAEVAHQASATEVRVGLQCDSLGMMLRVDDNGKGNRRTQAACACGLAGIRERVEACGGALRITAKSGGGTALSLRLPCARDLALT
ncbi:ATP-binding protein [Massilia sp. CMS3.1]|uniref:ATP-binding protein n=1 Tax=Massilia sp. CMS3.1 TaxID=3373083 RepID=UPI003EE7E23A